MAKNVQAFGNGAGVLIYSWHGVCVIDLVQILYLEMKADGESRVAFRICIADYRQKSSIMHHFFYLSGCSYEAASHRIPFLGVVHIWSLFPLVGSKSHGLDWCILLYCEVYVPKKVTDAR
jgi:hypothetical protein